MKKNWLVLVVVSALAICAVGYLASPLLALNGLRSALKTGDRDALERLVDFPSVRDSLKSQLRARLLKSMGSDKSLRDNPFAGLAMLAAPAIIDQMLEAAVTPEGLSTVIRQGRIERQDAAAASAGKGGPSRAADTPMRAEHLRYQDLDTFKADLASNDGKSAVTVVLRRQGLFSWQVKRLDLPETLMDDAPSASTVDPRRAAAAAAAEDEAARIREEAPGAIASAAVSQ